LLFFKLPARWRERETENGGDDAGGNEGEKKNIFYLPEPFILGWRAGAILRDFCDVLATF
jgi:hypothetical protein